jgi:hypothetical protein
MAKLSEADRLRGWLLYNRLLEQMQQDVPIAIPNVGPNPEPMGKLYFKRSEIFERIVAKMKEMAPDGVSSQHQFVEILEQAINTINNELKREMSREEMADIVLTINDVERELMFTPYQALNESRIGMGKNYVWKEALRGMVEKYVIENASPDMNKEKIQDLINIGIAKAKEEILSKLDETFDMIYNTLRMVPAEAFFAGQ